MSRLADDQKDQEQKTTEQAATQPEETPQAESTPAQEEPKAEEAAPAEESKAEKPKAEEAKKESARPSNGGKPVSKDLEKIIESIGKLSVLELADLVHALEDKFGVSASAPVAVAGPAAASNGGEPQEEQTTFNVILSNAGANKIGVIKAVREIVPTLGLKEAKDLVEAAPKPVVEGVNKETANEAKTKLTAAGATVELQ